MADTSYLALFKDIPDRIYFPNPQQPVENPQQQPTPLTYPQQPQINFKTPDEYASQSREAVAQNNQNQNPQFNLRDFKNPPSREQNMTNFIAGISTQPNLTPQQMEDAKNLFNLKKYYDDIERGLAANKDLSADTVAAWRNEQKNVADTAAMIRRTAEATGFNADAYGLGSENTLDESVQALHYLQNRDMKNFLDLKSAYEKASDRYNELRAQGVEPSRARYLANREFDGNRRDVMNQLSNALHTYGINADGSYNSYGHQIMEKMYQENPKLVTDLYTSQFATPRERYSAQQTLFGNLLTQAGANDRAAAQLNTEIWRQIFGAANTRDNLNLTLDANESQFARSLKLNRDKFEADNEYRQQQLELEDVKTQIQAFKAQDEAYRNSPAGQLEQWMIVAPYATGSNDSEVNRKWAAGQITKGSNLNNKSDSKLEAATNIFTGNAYTIKQELSNGNYDNAKELIAAERARIRSSSLTENPYAEVVTLDQRKPWEELLDTFEKVANKEITFADMMKNFYGVMGKVYIGNGDAYMAYLMNHHGELEEMIRNAPRTTPETQSVAGKYWGNRPTTDSNGNPIKYGR